MALEHIVNLSLVVEKMQDVEYSMVVKIQDHTYLHPLLSYAPLLRLQYLISSLLTLTVILKRQIDYSPRDVCNQGHGRRSQSRENFKSHLSKILYIKAAAEGHLYECNGRRIREINNDR
jgi:hypothetical protein